MPIDVWRICRRLLTAWISICAIFLLVVIVIYVLFWPLAKPMSKLLNRWLGKETPQLYSHQRLEEIIHDHQPLGRIDRLIMTKAELPVRCSLVKDSWRFGYADEQVSSWIWMMS